MKKKLLIFDFDGTIADTFQLGTQIIIRVAEELGIEGITAEECLNWRHLKAQEVIKKMGVSFFKIPILAIKFQKELHLRISELKPFEKIPKIIKTLFNRKYELGIVTSNSSKNVDIFLKHYNLRECFSFIHSEKSLFGKSPILNRIMRQKKIKQKEVVYIGDETRDIEACHKSKIDIISVTWGFNSKELLESLMPTKLIDDPQELLALLS